MNLQILVLICILGECIKRLQSTIITLFADRPMINSKPEDKECGNGPSLAGIFEDDKTLMDLNETVQVRISCVHQCTYNIMICVHEHVIIEFVLSINHSCYMYMLHLE